MTNDRLMWLLGNWADWMKIPSSNLGYPSRSLMIASGGGSGDCEFEIMCESADTACALAIDSIIDSLTMPQRTAINHQWLKVAHHYPTQILDYDEALDHIMRLCDKRGVV